MDLELSILQLQMGFKLQTESLFLTPTPLPLKTPLSKVMRPWEWGLWAGAVCWAYRKVMWGSVLFWPLQCTSGPILHVSPSSGVNCLLDVPTRSGCTRWFVLFVDRNMMPLLVAQSMGNLEHSGTPLSDRIIITHARFLDNHKDIAKLNPNKSYKTLIY
jgi:hypothetical protein